PPSTVYRFRKFDRRNKAAVAGVAAVIVALTAGVVASRIFAVRARHDNFAARTQEKRADREAAKAREEADKQAAINQFLIKMLGSANPMPNTGTENVGEKANDKARGKDVTVAQVLDDAVRELDAGSLKGRPEIEITVRRPVGDTYMS